MRADVVWYFLCTRHRASPFNDLGNSVNTSVILILQIKKPTLREIKSVLKNMQAKWQSWDFLQWSDFTLQAFIMCSWISNTS